MLLTSNAVNPANKRTSQAINNLPTVIGVFQYRSFDIYPNDPNISTQQHLESIQFSTRRVFNAALCYIGIQSTHHVARTHLPR